MNMKLKCPYCNEIGSVDTRFLLAKGKFIGDDRNQTSPQELGKEPFEAPGYFKEIKCKCGWSYFIEVNIKKKL